MCNMSGNHTLQVFVEMDWSLLGVPHISCTRNRNEEQGGQKGKKLLKIIWAMQVGGRSVEKG